MHVQLPCQQMRTNEGMCGAHKHMRLPPSCTGMTTGASLRLLSDLKAISQEPPEGCSGAPIADSLFCWSASISGPPDSPWEGGIFSLRCALAAPPAMPNFLLRWSKGCLPSEALPCDAAG